MLLSLVFFIVFVCPTFQSIVAATNIRINVYKFVSTHFILCLRVKNFLEFVVLRSKERLRKHVFVNKLQINRN